MPRAIHEKVLGTFDRARVAMETLLAEDEARWNAREKEHAEQLQRLRDALVAAQDQNFSEQLARANEALAQQEQSIARLDAERVRLSKALDEWKVQYEEQRGKNLTLQVQIETLESRIRAAEPAKPGFSMRATNGEPIVAAMARLREQLAQSGVEPEIVELVLPDPQYVGLVVADGDHEWWAQRVLRLTGPAGTGTMIVPPQGSPTAIEMTSQVPTDRRCTLELQNVHVHGAVNLSATGGMTLRLLGASTLHSRPGT